jgi:hypothetical protein
MTTPPNDDYSDEERAADERDNARRFRWLLGGTVAAAIALTAGAIALRGAHAASSVAVGGALAAANLVAFRSVLATLTAAVAGTGRAGGVVSVLLGMKLLILLAGVWVLLSWHVVTPAGLALGYVALPIGVAIGTLLCDKAHAS